MRIGRVFATLVLFSSILHAWVAAAQDFMEPWNFPEIAKRVPHFDARMRSSVPEVRMRVLRELTYFNQRDSKVYVPFLRRLLKDPAPNIRWETLVRLDDHGVIVTRDELPVSVQVPLVGLLAPDDDASVDTFCRTARGGDAPAGWAIRALGLIGEGDAAPLAENLLTDSNVFTRYSAASALVHFGKVEQGKAALKAIAECTDSRSNFYRYSAAERLCRLGEKRYLKVLIDLADERATYADGPLTLLEDLTGRYFITADEWKAWWELEGKRTWN